MYFHTSEDVAAFLTAHPQVTNLDIFDSPITNLSGLPAGQLAVLHIHNCPHLKSVEGLPEPLKALFFSNCPAFESMPQLPATLERLAFADCPALQGDFVSALPPSLLRIVVIDCHGLTGDVETLVLPNLEHLELTNCSGLFGQIPGARLRSGGPLHQMTVSGCPRVSNGMNDII